RLARRIVAIIDPEGTFADDHHHGRRRGATLSHNGDGSGELRAHLTPSALAVWEAVLSSRPGADSRRRATAGCCPCPTHSRSPPKPRSSRSFSTTQALCCHTDAHAAPHPRGNGSRWLPATAAA